MPNNKPRCEICWFFDGKHCIRWPPTPLSPVTSVFPVVQKTDWCGEYQQVAEDADEVKREKGWARTAWVKEDG